MYTGVDLASLLESPSKHDAVTPPSARDVNLPYSMNLAPTANFPRIALVNKAQDQPKRTLYPAVTPICCSTMHLVRSVIVASGELRRVVKVVIVCVAHGRVVECVGEDGRAVIV